MKKRLVALPLVLVAAISGQAQILIDSIPLPGISQGFWGIHVTPDTIFLGADFNGNVYFFDHQGAQLGSEPTGFTVNHGLVKQAGSYLIAQDYTPNGAHLYEVSLTGGSLLNTWMFPPVIGGNSSGIGGICAHGGAVWYTMYYPDFDVYPYAYAYEWTPGQTMASDTVPLLGAQPQGIAFKGDTLLYVIDDIDGDAERIYAYDLTNGQDLGFVDLPDPDGDQSPRGLFYDGTYLYLVANRVGGAAFAYQTIYIYTFDATTAVWQHDDLPRLSAHPLPARDMLMVQNPLAHPIPATLFDALERAAMRIILRPGANSIDVHALPSGTYFLRSSEAATLRVLKH